MIPELTKELFKAPPPVTGQAKLALDQWEKGFKSFDLRLGRAEATRIGGQFLNGWSCGLKVQQLANRGGFLNAL